MVDIKYRAFEAADAAPTHGLAKATFPGAKGSLAAWEAWTGKDFVGAVAYEGDRLLGMLNLKRVVYRVAPGARLTAWVQHGVATDEAARGKGVGSALQLKARELLSGRGDLFFVYRGAEKSPAYRFYEKSGLYDVGTARAYRLAGTPGTALPSDCQTLSEAAFFARSGEAFAAYRAARKNLAGQPEKDADTLRRQVENTRASRGGDYRFVYLTRMERNVIADYCVLAGAGDALKIMDFTVTGATAARDLLSGALTLTPTLSLDVSPGSSLETTARAFGATANSRDLSVTFMLAGVLDIESAGAKIWNPVPALENVEVRVWTAAREGVMRRVKSPERTIVLEMKENALPALLCRRLSVKAAVAEERMTLLGHREGDIDALDEALRPSAWHYDYIDHL